MLMAISRNFFLRLAITVYWTLPLRLSGTKRRWLPRGTGRERRSTEESGKQSCSTFFVVRIHCSRLSGLFLGSIFFNSPLVIGTDICTMPCTLPLVRRCGSSLQSSEPRHHAELERLCCMFARNLRSLSKALGYVGCLPPVTYHSSEDSPPRLSKTLPLCSFVDALEVASRGQALTDTVCLI